MAFSHLHVHTEYSLLDGSNKITEYVKRVKELGMTAAAITDHGVMYGVIDFYKECKKQGIRPVLGCEVYVAPGSRLEKSGYYNDEGDNRYYHLILLAENNTGYQNLMHIVSQGFIDGFYYKPRVDREILEKYHEGIICLSACLAGEVARNLSRGMYDEARKAAIWHRDTFGKDNYFFELQDHGIPTQRTVNYGLRQLSEELGIPLVATNDCHYTYAEDAEAHDVLLCIQTKKKVQDTDRMRYEGGQYYVKSEEEMLSLFPYAKEAVHRTQEIADRCHVDITFNELKLPHYEAPEGFQSGDEYLTHLCYEGLKNRYPETYQTYENRLEEELQIIRQMGFVDYFLIVWDYINFAKTHNIPVGPGRGSAAGSIVSYALKITDIDPMRYQLLFERFLNPERVSMPDIDVDFCPDGRQDVIDYVNEKYGVDSVTQIITFGTLAARGAIRDVARVQDRSYQFGDAVAKMIPKELNITIADALKKNPELRKKYDEDEDIRNVIDTAMKLEGLPRNAGMHAAGVVITEEPVGEYVPLARNSGDGPIVTQFEKGVCEELGLVKMDFLGLRNLSVIRDAVEMIEKNYGVRLDMEKIDYDDKAVYNFISTGKTDGVFQLESAGMKSFMKELKPQNLEDVIAGISLYRPGPMEFIPRYIRGKNAGGEVVYDCEELRPILEPTYGCIVYQEQVMQIAQSLAGYSLGQADILRRAMSKKKGSVMEENRKIFIYGNPDENVEGCINRGIDEKVANKIYDEIVGFAAYAFNKSHAAAYSFVAYQTAYLKYYYPAEFMAALMSSVSDSGKIAEYIYECRSMGITVLPPSVNYGEGAFTAIFSERERDAKDDAGGESDAAQTKQLSRTIRYGMYSIRGLGKGVVDEIVRERALAGDYLSLDNFVTRTLPLGINKTMIENLVKAGALDDLPKKGTRRQMVLVGTTLAERKQSDKKHAMDGQMTLFEIADEETQQKLEVRFPDVGEYSRDELLYFEKEVLGIYLSGHPLEDDTELLHLNTTANSMGFVRKEEDFGLVEVGADVSGALDDEATMIADGTLVTLGGLVLEKTMKFTKKNEAMAFLTLEDMFGTVEVIVFPRYYEKFTDLLNENEKLLVYGRVQTDDLRDSKLICEDIKAFSEVPKKVWVKFPNRAAYEKEADKVETLTKKDDEADGRDEVVIFFDDTRDFFSLPPSQAIDADDETLAKWKAAFGEENIAVKYKKIAFGRKGYYNRR